MLTFDEEKTRWFMSRILPHEPALRAWLGRRSRAGADVEDVIQEAYSVLAGLERVDLIRNPRAYLFQVAQSVVVRHIRRSRVVSIQAADDLEGFDPADEAASPEQIAIDRDELQRLGEVIAAMPRQMRQAFILRRVHELPQRDIAKRMRLSESTVEKHLARGVKFLIDRVGHGGNSPSQTSKAMSSEKAAQNGRARDKQRH
jgi:RNA polymerase sigma factor (sigma-70 family)